MTSSLWVVYQPLIVGLGAVVLATAGNTLLEWYRQTLQDRRETNALRRAFAEELRAHRRMYSGAMTDEQRAETEGSFMVPIDQFMPVYENMIGKVGLLPAQEIEAILKAYSFLVLTPKNLMLMGQIHENQFASFVQVPVHYQAALEAMNTQMVAVIDTALHTLRSQEVAPEAQ